MTINNKQTKMNTGGLKECPFKLKLITNTVPRMMRELMAGMYHSQRKD
jgi:hypothetical protein